MPLAYETPTEIRIPVRDYKKVCIPGSVRTLDIGRPSSNKIIRCKNIKTKRWITVSYHVDKSNLEKRGDTYVAKNQRTKELMDSIRSQHGAIRRVV